MAAVNFPSPSKEILLFMHLRKRIAKSKTEGGFTLIELLVVIIIIGILLAIAIPSYLKFRDRANDSAAKANVRASVPGLEAYYADNNTYVGMTLAGIQSSYDAGIKNITFGTLTATSYCVKSTVGQATFNKQGPSADILSGTCP
jgi:prepilin-type N-terminal cleavage/methylation domain-containing protein